MTNSHVPSYAKASSSRQRNQGYEHHHTLPRYDVADGVTISP